MLDPIPLDMAPPTMLHSIIVKRERVVQLARLGLHLMERKKGRREEGRESVFVANPSRLDKVSVRLMARCMHAISLLVHVDVLTSYTYLSHVIDLPSLLLDLSTSIVTNCQAP